MLDGDTVASTGAPTLTTTSLALDGVLVRNMGDVAGEHTRPLGVDLVDLGAMAPLGDGSTGEFAMIFGDSFMAAVDEPDGSGGSSKPSGNHPAGSRLKRHRARLPNG